MPALLSAVVRVKEDFKADIDLKNCLDGLVPVASNGRFPPNASFSRMGYIVAPIVYHIRKGDPAREPVRHGVLIYIKASMLHGLGATAKGYRALNQAFPHEATSDQFFDANQFEAYRELGFLSTEQAIDDLKLHLGKSFSRTAILRRYANARKRNRIL